MDTDPQPRLTHAQELNNRAADLIEHGGKSLPLAIENLAQALKLAKCFGQQTSTGRAYDCVCDPCSLDYCMSYFQKVALHNKDWNDESSGSEYEDISRDGPFSDTSC